MNVFIVEDAPKTRKELANLLADEKGFAVVGEAGSVREALVGIEANLTGGGSFGHLAARR